jgi:hypothetical protein
MGALLKDLRWIAVLERYRRAVSLWGARQGVGQRLFGGVAFCQKLNIVAGARQALGLRRG